MLIPKIITTFLTLIFSIIAFSFVYFLLQNLPKAKVEIQYKLREENPYSSHLCQVFLSSDEIKELIIKTIKKENIESSKALILDRLSNLIEDKGFEIVISNESIKKGALSYEDIYSCYFFYNKKLYEIIIKI
ncbi:MAG: hypothetical protein QXQ19_02335 [Candidatus Aenigmatarchaeota archaeon]